MVTSKPNGKWNQTGDTDPSFFNIKDFKAFSQKVICEPQTLDLCCLLSYLHKNVQSNKTCVHMTIIEIICRIALPVCTANKHANDRRESAVYSKTLHDAKCFHCRCISLGAFLENHGPPQSFVNEGSNYPTSSWPSTTKHNVPVTQW